MNKILFRITGCLNYSRLKRSNFVRLQPAVTSTSTCFVQFMNSELDQSQQYDIYTQRRMGGYEFGGSNPNLCHDNFLVSQLTSDLLSLSIKER